ncbi:hypothetical protein CHUAL_003131 [Chamberlinius hualienensis]
MHRELDGTVTAFIREIYNGNQSLNQFDYELERALTEKCDVIVIEPETLARSTSNWIVFGNRLYRFSVALGISTYASYIYFPGWPIIYVSLSLCSAVCTGIYVVSWQTDHCCIYRIENRPNRQLFLRALQFYEENTAEATKTPLVLVRQKSYLYRLFQLCQFTVTLFAIYPVWRFICCLSYWN